MEMDPSEESSPCTVLLALDTSPFAVGDQVVPEYWPLEDDTLTSMLKNGFHSQGVFKSNLIQLKLLNQSNPNRKLIKIAKVWIGLNLIFYKPLGSGSNFEFNFQNRSNPIQTK